MMKCPSERNGTRLEVKGHIHRWKESLPERLARTTDPHVTCSDYNPAIINRLTLNKQSLGDDRVKTLAKAFQQSKLVTKIDLASNDFGDTGAEKLGNMLRLNKTIKYLSLHNNSIGNKGAQLLAAGLGHNVGLWYLDLSSNQIGDTGAQELGQMLRRNKTLHHLSLEDNSVGDKGAQSLAACLVTSFRLRYLDLTSNDIGDTGAKELGNMLQRRMILFHLYLHNNSIGDKGAQSLAADLGHNVRLDNLGLSGNRIGDLGSEALGTMLKKNQTLTVVSLQNNPLTGDRGVNCLICCLETNHTLQTLHLSHCTKNNMLGEEVAKSLGKMLKGNQGLRVLHFTFYNGKRPLDALDAKGKAIILEGMRQNFFPERLEPHKFFGSEIQCYCALNLQKYRRILKEHNEPSALWAYILSKVGKVVQDGDSITTPADLVYYYLQGKPDLVKGPYFSEQRE